MPVDVPIFGTRTFLWIVAEIHLFFAAAGSVELHRTVMEGEIMKMEPVPHLVVPAGGKVELKPLGLHLMLRELRGELMAGQKIELIFQFEKSGEVKVEAEVKGLIEKPMQEGH